MEQLADSSVQIMDYALTLTKRKKSNEWKVRYKIGNKWIRINI